MSSKYLAIISTDHHLTADNATIIKDILLEELDLAEKKKIQTHIWLGDVFDNRVSQREVCLSTLNDVLEEYDKRGHHVICIPGNHDKTSYTSKKSFLTPFKYHPSFTLVEELDGMQVEGVYCFFLPFFKDDILLDELEEIGDKRKKNILFGHFAVTGSKNMDGSEVSNLLKPSMFQMFKKVYLGHYHNYQRVGENIYHLGSVQQNNFGEDEKKGFWLLDSDLNVDLVSSTKGQVFKKLEIDLGETPHKQAVSLIKKFKKENPTARVRVEVWGEQSSLDAFDKDAFTKEGIDIKKKFKEVEEKHSILAEVKTLDKKDIEERFSAFCKENEYDEKEGKEILDKLMYGEEKGN